jgi:hypothetical protein
VKTTLDIQDALLERAKRHAKRVRLETLSWQDVREEAYDEPTAR